MNDYISIHEAIEKIEERGREKFTLDPAYLVYLRALKDVENDLRHMPAIDAVPVVRCKDCRWHIDEEPGMVYCRAIVGGWVHNDWFCKSGERKEDV